MTAFYPTHTPLGAANGRYRASLAQASGSAANAAYSTCLGAGGCPVEETRAPPLEDAGIRAGELIGYRAWLLLSDGLLHGMYMTDYVWRPGAVERVSKVANIWGEGLHAFKELREAKSQYGFYAGRDVVVFGEVALWGEVIEHEHGYRAEFASIRQLSAIHADYKALESRRSWKFWKPLRPPAKLEALRRLYGTPALTSQHRSTET